MSYWTERIQIGALSVPRFVGGPLDGITDSPFRKLVREFSQQELLYTEMRHVACIANDKRGMSLAFEQQERPLNYQIAANSLDFIEQALERVLTKGVDAIDLNVGCPSRQVTGSGSGSALMADSSRLETIVKRLRELVKIPLTVKIRAGFKEQNACDVAKMLEQCGIDLLSIHPRLQSQRFEGRPNYSLVAEIKKSVSVPVLVSGGVVNFTTAKMVYEQTGVDGFLIGRGIWARPWKLKELREHAAGRPFLVPLKSALLSAQRHFALMLEHYGSHGVYMFRKHLPLYLRGVADAAKLRAELVKSNDPQVINERLVDVAQNVSADCMVRI